MITGLFVSPDGETLRIEYDDGDGGIYELSATDFEPRDVPNIPSEWVRWTP